MLARQIKHNIQIGQYDAVAPLNCKVHLGPNRPNIDSANLSVFSKPITGNGARNLRHNFTHSRVINTQNGCSVKRHAVQKIDKCFFQIAKVVAIGFHMVGINVGNHRHDRKQIQKRSI